MSDYPYEAIVFLGDKDEIVEYTGDEVVRCKNCKHRHDSLLDGSPFEDFCDVFPAYIAKDDFCSYGERKEE